MENKVSVNELNAVLKGEHMAIDAYERYMEKIDDKDVKSKLQEIQQDHKLHSILISERIQDLNGHPVDGVGIRGKISEVATNIKDIRKNDPLSLLNAAKKGEDTGIKMAAEVVKGDLDYVSRKLIDGVLSDDTKHIAELNTMILEINTRQSIPTGIH